MLPQPYRLGICEVKVDVHVTVAERDSFDELISMFLLFSPALRIVCVLLFLSCIMSVGG